MRKAAQSQKRDIAYTIPSFLQTYGSKRPKAERLIISHENVSFASRPYIESRLACYRKRLVFRLSSTSKRLLVQTGNGFLLRAIMEFTAAGQSEILTPVPN